METNQQIPAEMQQGANKQTKDSNNLSENEIVEVNIPEKNKA